MGGKSYSEDEGEFHRNIQDTWRYFQRMGSCPAAGETGGQGVGRRGDEERQRTQTSRPDLYSTTKTFHGLPPGPPDCLLSPVSPHTDRFAPTSTYSMHRLLTYACVFINPSSCFFISLLPFRVVIADYVCRFPNEDRGKYVRMCIRTLDFCARVIAWISSGTNQNFRRREIFDFLLTCDETAGEYCTNIHTYIYIYILDARYNYVASRRRNS